MDRKCKRSFYIEYTLFFSIISGLIVYYYYSHGKTMIDYGGDGFRQHFKALVYYSRYLKELIDSILKGSFVLPQWDFVIGEGSDILKAFHYYCIGDIFTFFSFLCPEKWMYLYYDGATLVRMYFSGLAFAWICFYKNRKNIYGVLAGSLLYAFCAFSFSSMSGHVFFISAAVFLPLIILGTEKVICHDKPYLLILSVMLSSMSNIYFFYMNVLSTVLYVLIRLMFMDGTLMEKAKALFKIGLYSALGLIMSCVIFLPMVRTMLFSNRLDSDVSIGLLFSLKEYKTMFKNMTFGGIYFGGFSFLWLTSFSYLFYIRKNKTLIVLLITGLLFVGLPYLSAAYNAFTYPIDRWCYAMSLLVSYIITDSLEDISDLNECFYLNIALSVLYYLSCIFMDRSSWQLHVLFFAETLFFLFFVKYVKKKTLCELCAAGLVIISLLFQSFYEFGPAYWGYYKFGTDIEIVNNMDNDEHSVFRELEDDSLFRYSGNRMTLNQTVLGEHSSTQYYWSIANDYVVDFRKQLAYSDSSNHHYNNYSERFAQNALSGVKYYVNRKEDGLVPYGFEFMDNINGYDVYKSAYSLPLVFAYDNYILKDAWMKLDPAQKNEVLLQAAVVDQEQNLIDPNPIALDAVMIPYEMSTSPELIVENSRIEASGSQANLYLRAVCEEAGEYYVQFTGLYSDKLVAYIKVRYDGEEKSVTFKGNDNQHYTDRHDYLVNLGYMEGLHGTVEVNFSDGSNYSYGSISLLCQPLDRQISCISELKNLEIREISTERGSLKADVSLSDNRLLCFSIPYSEGWKAYVDGKEREVINCDIQYLGLQMEKGDHIIELKYSTPLLKEGAILSLMGSAIFVCLLIRDKKAIRKT